jgi:hypothetical protein
MAAQAAYPLRVEAELEPGLWSCLSPRIGRNRAFNRP